MNKSKRLRERTTGNCVGKQSIDLYKVYGALERRPQHPHFESSALEVSTATERWIPEGLAGACCTVVEVLSQPQGRTRAATDVNGGVSTVLLNIRPSLPSISAAESKSERNNIEGERV